MTFEVAPIAQLYDPVGQTLDPRVYTDDDVYHLELEHVFGASWLFLGHSCQIPRAGDYFTTYMGEDPVIVARQKDGSIRAFLNACRHRGMRLSRADAGNARSFTCSYHGWTYDTCGRLISIPTEQVYFRCPVEKQAWSAEQVPLLHEYRGFLFGCWDADARDFQDSIADVAFYLDPIFDGQTLAGGVEKWMVPANWKLGADQFVSDNYHFTTTHASGFQASLGLRPEIAARMRAPTSDDSRHAQSIYGHGIGFTSDPEWQEMRWRATFAPEVVDYLIGPHRDALVAKYGQIAGRDLGMGHGLMFPNLGFLSTGTLRVFHPKGPHAMEIWNYQMIPERAPKELHKRWCVASVNGFGGAGIFEQDDSENWSQIQRALRGQRASRAPLNLQMGADQQRDPAGRFPGTTDAADTDAGIRAFYRRWTQMMTQEMRISS